MNVAAIPIGLCLIFAGTGTYLGRGHIFHRLPGLTDSQQGLLIAVLGVVCFALGVASVL
jgi:hypothetical protein